MRDDHPGYCISPGYGRQVTTVERGKMSVFYELAKRLYEVEKKLDTWLEQYNTGIMRGPNLWILRAEILRAEEGKKEIMAAMKKEIPLDAARSLEIVDKITAEKENEAGEKAEYFR